MKRFFRLLFFQLFWLMTVAAVAQGSTCPQIVQQAVDAADAACGSTGRNQACYGNIRLDVQPQPDAPSVTFSQPGDLVDVANIQSLTLSPFDQESSTWGVAVMKLQANLPDALPGQNVTFILFGDVHMQNAVVPPSTLEITAKNRVNVRQTPSTSADVIATLARGQRVTASGRTDAGDWLRIQLDSGDYGWVSAALTTVAGDAQTLAVVSADAPPPMKPMQAFYFRTGTLDAPCAEAPSSGILIQSPHSATQVNFMVNSVSITLGSTVYLQAQPDGMMTINVLEGGVRVTLGGSVYVPAGEHVQVRLDDNLVPVAPLGAVEPYDPQALSALPIRLLEAPITVAPPLSAAALPTAEAALAQTFPPLPVRTIARGGGCSIKGDTPTTATFINKTSRLVSVYWISYNCQEVLYQTLPPGASYTQKTFATHPWIVRDTITGDQLTGPDVSGHGEPITVTVSG